MRTRRWWIWGTLLTMAPRLLDAQVPTQKMAADAAFDDGKKLMGENRLAEACARFSESQRLEPASSTLLWLGECLEKQGKVASAWSTFREAAALATRQGKADREKTARERVAALEPRVPRVALRVPEGTPGLVLRLDGVELGAALWSTPLPVDPGRHTLDLSAPGRAPRQVAFEAREGASPAPLALPALDPLPATSASAPPSAATPPPVVTTSSPPPTAPGATTTAPASGVPVTGLLLAGGGALATAVGVVLQLGARSKADDSRARNDRLLYDEAKSQQTAAVVTMVVGGALIAGGVALILTSRSSSVALRLGPSVAPGGQGLWLDGRF